MRCLSCGTYMSVWGEDRKTGYLEERCPDCRMAVGHEIDHVAVYRYTGHATLIEGEPATAQYSLVGAVDIDKGWLVCGVSENLHNLAEDSLGPAIHPAAQI